MVILHKMEKGENRGIFRNFGKENEKGNASKKHVVMGGKTTQNLTGSNTLFGRAIFLCLLIVLVFGEKQIEMGGITQVDLRITM